MKKSADHTWFTACFLLLFCGCSTQPQPDTSTARATRGHDSAESIPVAEQVEQFCGACHPVPASSDFPKSAWREEVQQGFDLYFQSDRVGLRVPLFNDVLAYFEGPAPTELPVPRSSTGVAPGPLRFREETFGAPPQSFAISHIRMIDPGDTGTSCLLLTDMRTGDVVSTRFQGQACEFELIAKLRAPAHVEPCDLDADGRQDFVVADLGSFPPADHNLGQVVWLRPQPDGSAYEAITLLDSRGRIADVQPSDMDRDGDQDLVVAEFGWRRTGSILLLENTGIDAAGARASFTSHVLDHRHGAIHVPTVDINTDGNLDFVTIIGQEHEAVEVFHGTGDLEFQNSQIFHASTPAFGSSGIHLADVDRDGDTDILCTNGDMLDDYLLRASHAIRWLEHGERGAWTCHEITQMPGVARAICADLDRDGDQDIVACALIPNKSATNYPQLTFDSLIWLEQNDKHEFIRHVLETGRCHHAALAVGDFDADGDNDIAVGHFAFQDNEAIPQFSIWWREP